jgi:DNA repair exonuclease SbcCD ATPase subunit
MQVGPARFYDTDDPQVLFNVVAEEMRDIAKVTASFRIAHADGEVQPAMLSALLEVQSQLSNAEELEQRVAGFDSQLESYAAQLNEFRANLIKWDTLKHQLEPLEELMRSFEGSLGTVRESLSGRLGIGLTRTLMNPLRRGGGKTTLDELDEKWRGLEALIHLLAEHNHKTRVDP